MRCNCFNGLDDNDVAPKLAAVKFERLSPKQVLVFGPPEIVREAAWHALWNEGVPAPLIDVDKNLVAGTIGDAIRNTGAVLKAHIEAKPDGTLVSFASAPILGATGWDGDGRARKLVSWLEQILQDGFPEVKASARNTAPIAEPFGGGDPHKGRVALTTQPPQYGPVLAPKCGKAILYYGIASLFFCPLVAFFTLSYGATALLRYHREGDPGDKKQVLIGLSFALLSPLSALLIWRLTS